MLTTIPFNMADLIDKKQVTLPSGQTLRLREEPDYDTRITDFDAYGNVAPVERDRDYSRNKERPAGFNGAAEILHLPNGDNWWWQPPVEAMGSAWFTDTKLQNDTRNLVKDILMYGFHVIVLELCEGLDAYRKPIVIDYTAMGGIEPFVDNEVLADMVADIYYDLQDSIK